MLTPPTPPLPAGPSAAPAAFTRPYRAPELLFGGGCSPAADVWAAGCVLAELLLRKPLFQCHSDLDQLAAIFGVFGSPSASEQPGLASLPYYVELQPQAPRRLDQVRLDLPCLLPAVAGAFALCQNT
jgi:serine/threonine protein kinase